MPRIVLFVQFALCSQNYSIHSQSFGLLDFYYLLWLVLAVVKSSSVAISYHSGSENERISLWKSLSKEKKPDYQIF